MVKNYTKTYMKNAKKTTIGAVNKRSASRIAKVYGFKKVTTLNRATKKKRGAYELRR